jgi:hypothetical protein
MHVKDLEDLSSRLHQLQQQLQQQMRQQPQSAETRQRPLRQDDPLVEAARECDFMLPSELTVETLAETVDKKIETVKILLDRARRHESLPEDAQVAADQDYLASEEDLAAEHQSRQEDTARASGRPSQ